MTTLHIIADTTVTTELLHGEQTMSDVKRKFEAAAEAVKDLKDDPGNDAKLKLYALYKQGMDGDASGRRPGFTDMIGRAKFDAWAKVKGLSKEDAMREYVALCKSLGAKL
jgi:diazepam-binding inhibitor (GABA receptor modulating acyl-CoA-binding protein)